MTKYFVLSGFLFLYLKSFSQEEDIFTQDSLPYDAVINSTLGGKRMKYFGKIEFNFNQAFFENWISGGESTFTGQFNLDYNFNYSDRKGWVWDNNLMISMGGNKFSGSNIVKKADDRFEINSLLGKQINRFWNYAISVNFKSQLLPGFRYYSEDDIAKKEKLSRIFSPSILQIGLGWYFKKNDDSWINLSPIGARGVFVGSAYTRDLAEGQKYFGVRKGKNNALYLGASVSGFVNWWIIENITMENKMNIYINYIREVKNVDFELNSVIRMKVNKWVSSNLIIHLQYDDDMVSDLQIRELFGLGLSINL